MVRHVRFSTLLRFLLVVTPLLFLQTGCGTKNSTGNGQVEEIGKFDFNITGGRASLSVAFPKLTIDAGTRIPLRGLSANSYIELGPDFESGGLLFVASVALTDLANNNSLQSLGLPDGRLIPGTRSGVLPARVVGLPLFGNSLFYQGGDVFGLFLPIDLGALPVNITTRMRDQAGNIVGVLTAVAKGAKNGVSGALFLFPVENTLSEKVLLASTTK